MLTTPGFDYHLRKLRQRVDRLEEFLKHPDTLKHIQTDGRLIADAAFRIQHIAEDALSARELLKVIFKKDPTRPRTKKAKAK